MHQSCSGCAQRIFVKQLTHAVRLQMISTGAIACVEGGGHFRPNRHAELARDMFRALERSIGEPSMCWPCTHGKALHVAPLARHKERSALCAA